MTSPRPSDQHFTPKWLAKLMAETLDSRAHPKVADFCAGDGSLLVAATAHNPSTFPFASDIDVGLVEGLRREFPSWTVSRLDVLSSASRSQSRVWRSAPFDGVLLNPPFSYRGARRSTTRLGLEAFTGSPAAICVLAGLSALTPNGRLAAIVPKSSLRSDMDRATWRKIGSLAKVMHREPLGSRSFKNVVADVELVVLDREVGHAVLPQDQHPRPDDISGPRFELIRGRIPVHLSPATTTSGVPFAHTTNLRAGALVDMRLTGAIKHSTRGPLLVFPRVGRATTEKFVVWPSTDHLILSDCLFAVRSAEIDALHALADRLRASTPQIRDLMSASCAPYWTIQQVVAFLRDLGANVTHVPATER